MFNRTTSSKACENVKALSRDKKEEEEPLMKNQLWFLWRPRFEKFVCNLVRTYHATFVNDMATKLKISLD